jgi:hypothetical protein
MPLNICLGERERIVHIVQQAVERGMVRELDAPARG